MCPPSSALSELLDRWKGAADCQLLERGLFSDLSDQTTTAVRAAWGASDDPYAMLLLLMILHPRRNVSVLEEILARMSFFPAAVRIAELQRAARPGMNHNGRDRWTFLYLGQQIQNGLRQLGAENGGATSVRLAEAVRTVVLDPYALLEAQSA